MDDVLMSKLDGGVGGGGGGGNDVRCLMKSFVISSPEETREWKKERRQMGKKLNMNVWWM